MKNRLFVLLVVIGCATTILSCEVLTCKGDKTFDPIIEQASERMNSMISEGCEYDVTNISSLLYGSTGYWRADAEFEYNSDYSSVTRINRDFDTPLWTGNNEPVLRIVNGSVIYRYALRLSDSVMVEQKGECLFDTHTLELAVTIEQSDDLEAENIKYVIKSLTAEALIVDWSVNGKYYRTLYIPTSLDDMVKVEATRRMANRLPEIENFDKESVTDGLVGIWECDTQLEYDSTWTIIKSVYSLFGKSNVVDGSKDRYTFSSDGTVELYQRVEDPTMEPIINNYVWSYDTEMNTIKFSIAEDTVAEYHLKGFGSDYMFIDCYDSTNSKSIRKGLTRIE